MAGDWFDEQQGGWYQRDDGGWVNGVASAPESDGSGRSERPSGQSRSAQEDYKRWYINELYQEYLGRDANEGELSGFGSGYEMDQVKQILSRSDEAKAYTQRKADEGKQQTGGGQGGGGSDRERIDAMLQAVDSTDDPNYWYQLAEQHGGLDATGVDWMNDRIRRGDGSSLVKSGQLSKYVDTSASSSSLENFPEFSYAGWDQSFTAPEWTKEFTAPDAEALKSDPGYQARLEAGQQAMERSAAARGTLLTGGTQKDLAQYAQDYAANEYKDAYGRALGEYQLGYEDYLGDYDRAMQEYQTKYGEYSDAYNRALGEYGQKYGMASDAYNRAVDEYRYGKDQEQQSWKNQQDALESDYSRSYRTASLGYDAASKSAGSGLGDYYTQYGNANASGQVGSGNAWNNALGSAGQLPLAVALSRSSYNRR